MLTAARALKDADSLPQLLVSLLTHAAAPITRKLHGRQVDEGFSIEGVVCTHGIAPYLLGLLRIIVRLLQASNSIAYSAEVQESICDHEVTWTPHPSPNVLSTYEEPHRLLRLVEPLEMQPILIAQCAKLIGWSFLLAKPLSCAHANKRQYSNSGSSKSVNLRQKTLNREAGGQRRCNEGLTDLFCALEVLVCFRRAHIGKDLRQCFAGSSHA